MRLIDSNHMLLMEFTSCLEEGYSYHASLMQTYASSSRHNLLFENRHKSYLEEGYSYRAHARLRMQLRDLVVNVMMNS